MLLSDYCSLCIRRTYCDLCNYCVCNTTCTYASLFRGFCLLPGSTPDGCRVIFIHLKRVEPELFVISDFIKALSMVIDMLLMTSGSFGGLVIVYDMKGFSLGHMGRLAVNMVKKYIYFLQVGTPRDDLRDLAFGNS